MSCEEVRAAILGGELDDRHRAHLASCAACRAAEREIRERSAALAWPDVWEEPPLELGDRVIAAITGGEPLARSRARRRWSLVAAAAVIAGLVAVGIVVARPGGPDWEVALTGTDVAAGASATVEGWNTGYGTRIVVDTSGLPTLEPGHHYEFWFSGDLGLISAGTFTPGDDITLGVAVTRRDYPRLWVTLEPPDGDPAPSGVTVLN